MVNLKKEWEKHKANVNPGYKNPKEAKRIAEHQIKQDLLDEGVLRWKSDIDKEKEMEDLISSYFSKEDLAEQILDLNPFYYDNSKIWWSWNSKEFKWKIQDETDILNIVRKSSNYNTVNSKEKSEILEALRQEARFRKPKPAKKTWVQFKNKIVDVATGEEFEATKEYFITNPIPWEMHPDRFVETPVMDKLFIEWVGEEHTKTLKQIIAYCLIPDYPIHRLFCFIGSGLNGKSKFLELLRRFIGENNVTSTELDTLMNSRFEITKLHKKLACVMGETNFNELNQTSTLKKLTGQDVIGFEYKNKNPFDDLNYAKILIATNSLPTTSDKTVGFYRRWLIIDFPNQFNEVKDILATIPDEEYQCLAVRSMLILRELLDEKKFHNEGDIEARMKKFEEKSDFLKKFISDYLIEQIGEHITKNDFKKQFDAWCIENRHRVLAPNSLSMKMKTHGIVGGKKYFDWLYDGKGGQARVWEDVKWKD
jgi:P4 family phage/plasmid primase-like protien|tara:strand:+ start:8013 stop:9452 length:1440 start_codon:yes stop_codon:yes gene_type:complete